MHYLNHGVLERLPPNMCFTSKSTRAEVTRIVSRVIGPVLREEIAKLKAEGKEALFAGVLVGSEPSIDDYSKPNPELAKMMKEDGVPAGPLGYRVLLDRGYSAANPPDDFRKALATINQETIAFWCEQFVLAGIPVEKLYPHVAAPAPIEEMNAPIWTAFNKYSLPGWTTYAVGVLGESFKPIYDELEKHGNPPWAGVEANAGIPGSVVDWETYLAWHFNHGCVLVGVNMGATGEDLPRRLGESAFGDEAIAAYHKFLKGQPLVEKAVSMDRPEFRIQAKMKRVRAGIERWHASGKDPRPVGKLMEGAGPLAKCRQAGRAGKTGGSGARDAGRKRESAGRVSQGVRVRSRGGSKRCQHIRRFVGPGQHGIGQRLVPPGKIDCFQIAAVSQADQSLPVFKGHLVPEAGQGVLRERFAEGVVIDAGPELARVAESIFALRKNRRKLIELSTRTGKSSGRSPRVRCIDSRKLRSTGVTIATSSR